MVGDGAGRRLAGLLGPAAQRLLAEFRHQVVGLGAFNLYVAQMRYVALDADFLARLGKDGLLGEVGKHHQQHGLAFARALIGEPSAGHVYGVDAVDGAVGAVDVEFALVDIGQSARYLEIAAAASAGRKEHSAQGAQEKGTMRMTPTGG